jgi:hypothetical protein
MNTMGAVKHYRSLGLAVVPIPRPHKGPTRPNWQNQRWGVNDFAADDNVGLHLTGDVADIDLDSKEARRIAAHVLPKTTTSGRESVPDSHYWIRFNGAASYAKFNDPTAPVEAACLLELRIGHGKQTVVYPSFLYKNPEKPQLGTERVVWNGGTKLDGKLDFAIIGGSELARKVRLIAAAALVARHWDKGRRHDISLALAGTLLANGWDADATADFIQLVCVGAADRKEMADRIRTAMDTAKRRDAGGNATGMPTLRKLLGSEVVDKLLEWLDLRQPVETAAPPDDSWPEFPEQAYTGLGAEVADLYARYTEAPKQFIYISWLTVFGSLMSRTVTLSGHLRDEPRLYTVLLGPVANARKSTSIRFVTDFFRYVGEELEERRALQAPEVDEALQDAISLFGGHYQLYGLGSGEGIARKFEETPAILVVLDELSLLSSKTRQAGNIVGDLLKTLFDGTRFGNLTKDKEVKIEDGHLSVLTATTPESFERMWSEEALRGGLVSRFLPIYGRRTKTIPPGEIPPEELRPLVVRTADLILKIVMAQQPFLRLLRNAGKVGRVPWPVRLLDPALSMFEAFRRDLPSDATSDRLEVIGRRLMLLMTVTQDRHANWPKMDDDPKAPGRKIVRMPPDFALDHVSLRVAPAALSLLRYTFDVRRHAAPLTGERPAERMEQAIIRFLKDHRGLRYSRSALYRGIHGSRYGGAEAMDKTLPHLRGLEGISIERDGRGEVRAVWMA